MRDTGEVKATTAEGKPVETATSFNAIKQIPPELREILPVFERGSIVSIDEATRINPLAVPVKSFLFDRNFSKRKLKPEDWQNAMNVFNDTAPQRLKGKTDAAKAEKTEIESIFTDADIPEQEKLKRLWRLIRDSGDR